MESSQRGSLWTDVPSIPVVDLNTTAVPSQFMPLQQSLQGEYYANDDKNMMKLAIWTFILMFRI